MKNLATIFFLIFCITELALAQSELENFCGLEDGDMMLMSTPADFPGDGQHITSHGTLTVLVVFAKFPMIQIRIQPSGRMTDFRALQIQSSTAQKVKIRHIS